MNPAIYGLHNGLEPRRMTLRVPVTAPKLMRVLSRVYRERREDLLDEALLLLDVMDCKERNNEVERAAWHEAFRS